MSSSSPAHKNPPDPLELYGDVKAITTIFYWFAGVTCLAFTVGVVVLLLNQNYWQAVFMAISLPFVMLSMVFLRRQKFENAAVFLTVTLFIQITIQSTAGLGIHHIANLGFPAILIIASLVIRKRTLIFLTLLAVACAAWLVFGELSGAYTPHTLVHSVPWDFITVAVIFCATAFMVSILSDAVIRSNRGLHHELVEREKVEERLAYDAQHDALTNLPNRSLFMQRLALRLDYAKEAPEKSFAVLFIDLDRFKVVNDSLGHAAGDQILIAAAQRLKECLRMEDFVARLSGDEFAILLNDLENEANALQIADRIQQRLTASSMLGEVDRVTTASIGIAIYHKNYMVAQEMLRDADSAMYRAKASGGGCAQIFDATMFASALSLLQMEADLKRAVARQEWRVYYQPICLLPELKIVGVEALVRWAHPERGLIFPSDFIPVAEETGQILPLGEYVLRTACAQVRYWREKICPELWVSVNLSGRQFQDRTLVAQIEQTLADTGLSPESLYLEVTESVAMKDLAYSARVLNELASRGIGAALDDFGNGYSSLGYLNQFPFQKIKIDHSFIQDILGNANSEAIISAIISMGHTLKLSVVAEGVETQKQLDFLKSAGCDYMQGFLFCQPVPPEQLGKLLRKKNARISSAGTPGGDM